MSRPTVTSAARTPEGARLELDTGEVLQVSHEENAGLTSTRPYILRLEGQDRALNVPAQLVAQVAQALGIVSRAPDALSAAHDKAQRLIMSSAFEHLPHVAGVELLPSGAGRLHLAGGQFVDVPKEQNARFTPEGYAPSVLTLVVPGPVRPAFIVPDALRLPIMRALGFDLSEFEGRPDLPQVVGVEQLPSRAARLTLDAGYTFTLSREGTPRVSLSALGADGRASLLTDWKSSAAPVFMVPCALYDELGRIFDLAARPATLERVELTPRAALLMGGGKRVEVPRPFWPQLGYPLPLEAGEPIDVSIYTADPRLSSPYAECPKVSNWQVYPDTPAGRACLEALGLAAEVDAQGPL